MKEKKIGISKIVIQIGDKETALTVEQAKELQAALNAVLGEKIIEREVYPRWWYVDGSKTYPPYVTYGTVMTTNNTDTGSQYFSDASIHIQLNDGDGNLLPA